MKNLQKIRKECGLSQSQLAKSAGVSKVMVQQYEQGAKDINKAQALTLFKITRVLKCSVSDLLELEGVELPALEQETE